jgi:glucan biosynthesis protein C
MVVRTVFMWATIVALLGLAQRTLNRNGKMLRFLTRAVFPYYILHQTLIVAVGFWVGGCCCRCGWRPQSSPPPRLSAAWC